MNPVQLWSRFCSCGSKTEGDEEKISKDTFGRLAVSLYGMVSIGTDFFKWIKEPEFLLLDLPN